MKLAAYMGQTSNLPRSSGGSTPKWRRVALPVLHGLVVAAHKRMVDAHHYQGRSSSLSRKKFEQFYHHNDVDSAR